MKRMHVERVEGSYKGQIQNLRGDNREGGEGQENRRPWKMEERWGKDGYDISMSNEGDG